MEPRHKSVGHDNGNEKAKHTRKQEENNLIIRKEISMEKLICEKPGTLTYMQAEIPALGQGESLLKIRRIGICGTDIHAYAGNQPFFDYPRVLGHEIAADYIAGDAPGYQAGDRVTVIPYLTAGTDIAARLGKPNCATDMQVLGVHIDGGMAEYIVVPSSSLRKSEGLSYEELVIVEPLAIGAHAVHRAQVIAGEYTLVIGAGPIGLGIITLASIAAAQVIVLDMDPERLQKAKEFGAQHTILASDPTVYQQIQQLTAGDMPTLIFDATGNTQAINQAFHYMAHGARYVLVGLQKEEIHFSHPEFHKREGTLMSSRNALAQDFELVMKCLHEKSILADQYISKQIPFREAATLFSHPDKPLLKGIKTVIYFD